MIEHYPFQNTPLPYPYNALEPYIDSETMHLHHDAHLKGYVDSLNAVLEKYPALQDKTLEQLLLLPAARPMPRMNSSLMNTSQMNSPQMNSSPMRSRRGAVNPPMHSQPIQNRPITPEDREKLRRSAGGVYNHRLFFNSMAPTAKRQPRGQLAAAINSTFGSFDNFKARFSDAAASVFGSGYAWLGVDRRGQLVIVTSENQDVPPGICPLLNLDVWEHAYYLKHANLRADYIADWWNVVNFPAAEARYQSCTM